MGIQDLFHVPLSGARPVFGERHNTRVTEDCPAVGQEQKEYNLGGRGKILTVFLMD